MIYVILILFAWIAFAQVGMRRTLPDNIAVKDFSRSGLTLHVNIFQINNRSLHYVSTGSANLSTIVFIHGSPRSWTSFKKFLKDRKLLLHYRMVGIDRPGYGHSDFGNVLHIHEQAELISNLLDTFINDQPIYLVGHSMGGPLVVALASMRSYISGIVIVAGALNPDEEKQGNWRKIFIKTPLNYLLPGAWRTSNEEAFNLKNDLKKLYNDFAKIKCSVFLMHGTKDRIVSYRNTEWAGKMFTNAKKLESIFLADAGHYIPWKNYDELKKLLLKLNP